MDVRDREKWIRKIKRENINEHLSNERTLLAWIRTSIGIMAFGFVVVKFSLFVKQFFLFLGKEANDVSHGFSSMIGVLIVLAGALVLVLSYFKYKQTEKQISDESFRPSSALLLTLIASIFLISILLVVYLLENTGVIMGK
jgi:putative membrane protein